MTYTPEQFTKSGTEQGHQTAIFCWAQQSRAQYPELALLFAVPNGGTRHKAEAARMVAAGVKAGVPDIWLPVARGGFFSCIIELKRPKSSSKAKGRTSALQSPWVERLQAQGHYVRVCYGFEEAKDTLQWYLAQSKTLPASGSGG